MKPLKKSASIMVLTVILMCCVASFIFDIAFLHPASWVIAFKIVLCTIQCTLMALVIRHLAIKDCNKANSPNGDKTTRFKRKEKNALEAKMLETQSEIAALQSQINPHFLYNTLETIRGKALLHDATEIADMIEVLARLFRYNISRNKESATLSDELENARNCISIYNYRFRNRFHLVEELDDIDAIKSKLILPVLTLQPIVENAIHHGLEKKLGEGRIVMRSFQTQSKFIIQIEDDGVGMDEATVAEIRNRLMSGEGADTTRNKDQKSSGIALLNVHKRLQLFFGKDYGLNIVSSKNIGTLVELAVPIIHLGEKMK